MPYSFPTIPDFKAQFMRDFPYAVPLLGGGSGAAATALVSGPNNSVSSLVLAASGTDYTETPTVLIYGGGGYGAAASAAISGGVVSTLTLINPGLGFTETPIVYLSNGLGDNSDFTKVTDYDLVSAFTSATQFNLSFALFGSQAAFSVAVNLLSAHYLCLQLQAGNTGLNGKAEWLTQAKMVGNVQESYQIPDRVMRSPYLSKLSKTTYGALFLEFVSPLLIANYQSYYGGTQP